MEAKKSNSTEAERALTPVDDAFIPLVPGPLATKKRNLESAFPEPSPHRETKRVRSQSPLRAPPEQCEGTNVARNGIDVAYNCGDSATLSSDSFETKRAEPELPLDPALIVESLVVHSDNDCPTTRHPQGTDQAQIEIPIDPVLIQQPLVTAPDDGNATTAASESSGMRKTEPVAPLKTDPQEKASITDGDVRLDIAAFCDELRTVLLESTELFRRIKNSMQNYRHATGEATAKGIADLTVHYILAAGDSKMLAKVEATCFPFKDELATPNKNVGATSGPNLFLGDATDSGICLPDDPNQKRSSAVPCTASCNVYQDTSTQTESMAACAISGTHESHAPDCSDLDDTELWKRELESIRRCQPLVTGSYTRVNVPLRDTVKKEVTGNMKGDQDVNTKIKLAPRYRLRSSIGTKQDIKRKSNDIIALSDTDTDNVDLVRPRDSYPIGGGRIPGYDVGSEHSHMSDNDPATSSHATSISDEDIRPLNRRPCYTYSSNQRINSTVGFSGEEKGFDENDIRELTRHHNQTMFPMQQYSSNDNSVNDYDGRYSLNHNTGLDVFGWGSAGCPAQPIVDGLGRTHVERERSRSPDYRRDERTVRNGHRASREYSFRRPRGISPVQACAEDAEQQCVGATMQSNLPAPRKLRYIRDEPENLTFYGYSPPKRPDLETAKVLRYQDRVNEVGELPGPRSALRFNLDSYIHDIGSAATGLEHDIKRVTQDTFYACETLDEEQALQSIWTNQSKRLYKGFPLVEEIGFVSVTNQVQPDGDCYWRALAYILHGKPARWNMIKADHLAYMQHVLSDKTHPRHKHYVKLNAQFFETRGGGGKDGNSVTTPRFKANIWQLLHLPHSWTPGVMQQITADLYNIHLITFTYDQSKKMCSEVSIRGAYNSRHVFMLFTDNSHFQPLIVNEYLSWEFRYPRVTQAATARFSNAPKASSKKQALEHPWRNDWTKEVLPPVPRSHGCDLFQMSLLMDTALT